MFKKYWWIFLAAAGLGVVIGNISAGILTLTMTKLFESEAIIEVKPPASKNRNSDSQSSHDFVTAQIAKIKSHQILSEVAENFEYTNENRTLGDSTVESLREAISCVPFGREGMISIKVRLPLKVDARNVTEEIVRVFEVHQIVPLTPEEEKRHKEIADEEAVLRKKEDELLRRLRPPIPSSGRVQFYPDPGSIEEALTASASLELKKAVGRIDILGQELEQMEVAAKSRRVTVTIIRAPEISESPVSPDIHANLRMGRFIGAIVFTIIAFPIVWCMNRGRKTSAQLA